ncbi:hypothetical protein [Candidatus Palauibacter sp.]|uniref:hypothetical protein n=1 Tax=Candidatus Palauibacter sp. TaxID=3101350 RepID=UPI003D0C006A
MSREELKAHIEVLEKAYEFFLSYAALGAEQEEASKVGGQLREYLSRTDAALGALANDLGGLLAAEGLEPAGAYRDMIDVTSADAARAGAAVRIVLAQETISSQLIDNLNASSHLRALLTDLFLLDDVV